jgi:hypothetical protein
MPAWVALSPANLQSGCMKFLPGSQTQDHLQHVDTFHKDNLLSRGQEIAVKVESVDCMLNPGEMSLHHVKLVHGSEPNRSNDRRIGLAIRYIPTASISSRCATPPLSCVAWIGTATSTMSRDRNAISTSKRSRRTPTPSESRRSIPARTSRHSAPERGLARQTTSGESGANGRGTQAADGARSQGAQKKPGKRT